MLTQKEHVRLRQIWHAAIDLIIYGAPNHWEGAHERWISAAPKINEAFSRFLEDHDPYFAPKTPLNLHPDRGADRISVDGADGNNGIDGV